MATMNKCLFIGRLGKDPELKYTAAGQAVCNFSIAVDMSYKKEGQKVEQTEWINIVAWRQTAEFCGNYLSKGRLVMVEGKFQTRKWQTDSGENRYTTEIVADNVQGLERAPEQAAQQPQQPQQREKFDGGSDMGGTDLPF